MASLRDSEHVEAAVSRPMLLSPRRGWLHSPPYRGLVPWAAICRRFAAGARARSLLYCAATAKYPLRALPFEPSLERISSLRHLPSLLGLVGPYPIPYWVPSSC